MRSAFGAPSWLSARCIKGALDCEFGTAVLIAASPGYGEPAIQQAMQLPLVHVFAFVAELTRTQRLHLRRHPVVRFGP